MDIHFRQDSGTLSIKTTINVPGHGNVVFSATSSLGNEYFAGFVVEAMREQFSKQLNAIRQESYCQGWRDAKSKKTAKQTWFSSVLRICA